MDLQEGAHQLFGVTTGTLSCVTRCITLQSDHFVIWQAVPPLQLFQFTTSREPRTLFQCTPVNIRYPITTVKKALEMVSCAHRTHQSKTDMSTAYLSAPAEYEECSLSGNDYSYVLYPFTCPTSKKSQQRFRAGA
jgi:hypothetical protein